MKRHDKEITDRTLIDEIIKKSDVCRLGLTKENVPYIVPMSFGFDGENLYFHTAQEGRKIDFFEAGNPVCFEFEADVETVTHDENPCAWTSYYKSVIGYGAIEELNDLEEKTHALNEVMLQYSGKKWAFTPQMIKTVRVWKVVIDTISGKQSPVKK